jgi:hypothetical protein
MPCFDHEVLVPGDLNTLWNAGYSVSELWGMSKPAQRATSVIKMPHTLLWGILGIVEYQVDKGAGQRYLRDRLLSGDWLAIGYASNDEAKSLVLVPKFEDPQFGRKPSAIGDDTIQYLDVRVVHSQFEPVSAS